MHSRSSDYYQSHAEKLDEFLNTSEFNVQKSGKDSFEPFGDLYFPYREMGAINSIHLFGLFFLIIGQINLDIRKLLI
jgi:hypothetical protein